MNVLLGATTQPRASDALAPALKGILHAVSAAWPLLLLIGLVAVGKLAYRLYHLRRLSKSGIAEIDLMDGRTFEIFLGTFFRRLGYGVEVTRYRGDYGADLVISKSGRRIAVQAKRWSKRIGVKAVQETVAAKGYYNADAALVVANREFTDPARRLARANKVELWDRGVLITKLLAVRSERNATADSEAPSVEQPLAD